MEGRKGAHVQESQVATSSSSASSASSFASISLVHPAAIVRGSWELDPLQVTSLERAKDYVEGRLSPRDLNSLPQGAVLYPTLEDLEEFSRDPGGLASGLAVDIESAGRHLICVGLTRLSDLGYLCVRFRKEGGYLYWPSFTQLYQAVEWLDNLLGDPSIPLYFHNGQAFDVPELTHFTYQDGEWHGFRLAGFTDLGYDTMLVQLTAMAGFPKSLQFCATYHLGFPVWKTLVSEDEEGAEGK